MGSDTGLKGDVAELIRVAAVGSSHGVVLSLQFEVSSLKCITSRTDE